MQSLGWLSALVWGYVWGSVASAVLVSRIMGLPDPRTQGSGNPGATNVLRLGGKKAAALTLLGDLLKGLVPVLIVKLIWPHAQTAWLMAGIGAFFGHLLPVFFGFKGGKGVATALGVLLAWHWPLALIVLAVWIAVFAVTRVSSLSALVAAFCAPWMAFLLIDDKQTPIMVLAMVGVLIYRHKDNIARLKSGQEGAFRRKS